MNVKGVTWSNKNKPITTRELLGILCNLASDTTINLDQPIEFGAKTANEYLAFVSTNVKGKLSLDPQIKD